MTGKIVQLDDYRPHVSGAARCMYCWHEWFAVTPAPESDQPCDIWLECPKCHRSRGQYKMAFSANAPFYMCECGNSMFTMHNAGAFCPNCGVWHDFPDPDHNDTPPDDAA